MVRQYVDETWNLRVLDSGNWEHKGGGGLSNMTYLFCSLRKLHVTFVNAKKVTFLGLSVSLNCYTSTQNTCTRLVQSASRDDYKYAVLTDQQCAPGNIEVVTVLCLNDFCLIFCVVLSLKYNKTNSDWRVDHY